MLYIVTIIIVFLDQLTKLMAIRLLKGGSPYVIIENFFQFSYVENFGAAFGIMQNKKLFFVIISLIVIIGIGIFLVKNYDNIGRLLKIGLVMLIGGAIGNLIDRIRFGYVVDFISFRFGEGYDFPVFNIADISIVLGTIIIMILVLLNKQEI